MNIFFFKGKKLIEGSRRKYSIFFPKCYNSALKSRVSLKNLFFISSYNFPFQRKKKKQREDLKLNILNAKGKESSPMTHASFKEFQERQLVLIIHYCLMQRFFLQTDFEAILK